MTDERPTSGDQPPWPPDPTTDGQPVEPEYQPPAGPADIPAPPPATPLPPAPATPLPPAPPAAPLPPAPLAAPPPAPPLGGPSGPPLPPAYGRPTDFGRLPPDRRRGSPVLFLALAVIALVIVLLLVAGLILRVGPFAPGPTGSPTSPRPTPPLVTPALPTQTPATERPTVRPPATTAGTPGPTATADATARPDATATPAASPPADAPAALLAHVPEPIRATCVAIPGLGPVLAQATCAADGGALPVSYVQFAEEADLQGEYDSFVALAEIERDSGNCAVPETWPSEHSYRVGDEIAGRWLCVETLGVPTIYWTDTRLNILGTVAHTAADHARLVEFWLNDAGPVP